MIKITVGSWKGPQEKEVLFQKAEPGKTFLLKSCASLYCEVWKEPPWNEHFDRERVLGDMQEELSFPCAEGFFAAYERELYHSEYESPIGEAIPTPSSEARAIVIGFCWGYYASKEKLRVISSSKALDFLEKQYGRAFYLSELGVDVLYRRRGIGGKLTELLIERVRTHDINAIVLRTHKESVSKYLYGKFRFKDLGISDRKYPNRIYWILPL